MKLLLDLSLKALHVRGELSHGCAQGVDGLREVGNRPGPGLGVDPAGNAVGTGDRVSDACDGHSATVGAAAWSCRCQRPHLDGVRYDACDWGWGTNWPLRGGVAPCR